jgi:hypothetical protein
MIEAPEVRIRAFHTTTQLRIVSTCGMKQSRMHVSAAQIRKDRADGRLKPPADGERLLDWYAGVQAAYAEKESDEE